MVLFMLAGYETTSTTLTYCSFVLAKHQEEQIKLLDEINSYYSHDSDVFKLYI
jgi:cytochrome P450